MAEKTSDQLRVFVSHSSADNAFCNELVQALKARGANVWYDQQHLRGGELLDTIVRELKARPIFVVILSDDAFASEWVPKECRWAWRYYLRTPSRLILPVVVRPIQPSHWDDFPYLDDFTRIEGPNHQPYPAQEAIERTLAFLAPTAQTSPVQNESIWTLLARGRNLLADKQHDQALPVLEQATRQSPRSYQAWFNLGYVLSELGREEEAVSALDRAVRLRPNDPEAWYSKGRSLDRAGHYDEGLAAVARAIDLDPTFADAWCERAWAYAHLGGPEDALKAQETAILHDASEPGYLVNKGAFLSRLKRDKEALAVYDKALALDPRLADAWTNKGLTLHRMRRDKEALIAYDQALALDPTLPEAWLNKAVVLSALKRYQDALVTAERAIVLLDEDAEAWYWKANALFSLKRYDEALAAIDQAIVFDEASEVHYAAQYWRAKGECLSKLGRKAEADEALKQAKALEANY